MNGTSTGSRTTLSTQQARTKTQEAEAPNTMLELSSEIVGVFKEQFGRGPTRARAHWAGPDTLVVILEDTLTPAERNLVRMGEHQRLRDLRMFFQYAAVEALCGPVERITGRKVRAFFSGIDTLADGMALETFVLHPPGYDGPSRIDQGHAADRQNGDEGGQPRRSA